MQNPISRDIETLFKFLSIVKENPGITQTGILSHCNSSYDVITGLKNILIPSGFCKIMKANTVSSNIGITPDGKKLLEYLEILIQHNY